MAVTGASAWTHIWKAIRQLNPKNIEEEASRRIRVGVIGTQPLLEEAARYLLGNDPGAFDKAADTLLLLPMPLESSAQPLLRRCDIVFRSVDYTENIPGLAAQRLFSFASSSDLRQAVRQLIHVPILEYTHLPLARAFPGIRGEIATAIVQTVSVENAIFVVSTSLGNVIPNPLQPLMSVAEALGDIGVLTTNQVRMLFRLAAAFGHKPGYKEQTPEVVSVVGAAFGWRSIARELVGMLPVGAGLVPKAAIAFAATWAVGDGLIYYFATGKRLTRDEMKQRFDQAMEKGRAAAEGVMEKVKEGYTRYMPGANKPG